MLGADQYALAVVENDHEPIGHSAADDHFLTDCDEDYPEGFEVSDPQNAIVGRRKNC